MKTSNTINNRGSALKQFALGVAASAVVVCGSGLTARADYSNTVASLNPVAYWRLNEPVSPTLNYALGTATNRGAIAPAGNGTYRALHK